MQARIIPFNPNRRKQTPWHNVESAASVPYVQSLPPEKPVLRRVIVEQVVTVANPSDINYEKKLKKELAKEKKTVKKDVLEKLKSTRLQARKDLATELKATRAKLKELKERLRVLQNDVDFEDCQQEARYFCHKINTLISQHGYPAVPSPSVRPHPEAEGMPTESGIYFFWTNGVVEYVGQSVNLNNRVRLGSHHQLRENDAISFVLIHKHFMTWAENFYIGILQPVRNYGSGGSHNRHDPPQT